MHNDNTPTTVGPAGPAPRPSFGDYELLERIGQGGMGVVYRARHAPLGRVVALKMILSGQFASEEEVRRFRLEAEAAARLDHPSIVPVYETGERDGQHFHAMKLLRGGSLADHLPRYAGDPRAAARLLIDLARAVHHAHARGVIHRDLKPGNVLLDEDGRPHVTDFGLARLAERVGEQTRSGAIVGTPEYMAPEQAAGRKEITTAADVYALGAILYALLTGRPPLVGANTYETLQKVITEEPPRPSLLAPRVPRDLEVVCLKCLRKEPAQRYDTALSLADDLQRWLDGEPVRARPASSLERAVRWARRRPALAGVLFVSAVSLLALTGVLAAFNARLQATVGERDAALEQEQERARELGEALGREREARGREGEARGSAEASLRETRRALGASFAAQAQRAWEDYRPDQARDLLARVHPDGRLWEWRWLDRVARGNPAARLSGLQGRVVALAFSPDGRWMVTADGAALRLHDVRTRQQGRVLVKGSCSEVLFSGDGKQLAALCGKQAQLWDVAGGQKVRQWDGAASVALAAGRVALARGNDVVVMDTEGKELARIGPFLVPGESKEKKPISKPVPVRCVALSPDGRLVAAGGEHVVRVFDVSTRKELFSGLIGSPSGVGTDSFVAELVFSPDGESLAATSTVWNWSYGSYGEGSGSRVVVFDVARGKERFQVNASGAEPSVAAFSPDGRDLAVKERDGVIGIRDAFTRELRLSLRGVSDSHCLAFTAEGSRLAVGATGQVTFWGAATGQGAAALAGVRPDDVSPRGRFVAVSRDQGLDLVELPSGRVTRRLQTGSSPSGTLVSGDGALVCYRHYSPPSANTLHVWDAVAGRELWTFKGVYFPACFSPDGRSVAVACDGYPNGKIRCFDARTGRELFGAEAPSRGVRSLAFSPDGKHLAVGGGMWEVRVHDAVSGAVVQTIKEGHHGEFSDVCFSPDGERLATASIRPTRTEFGDHPPQVRVHHWRTGKELYKIPGRTGEMPSVTFSPDGHRLAAGTHGEVRLFDAASGAEVLSLPGAAEQFVMRVAFLDDDTLVGAHRSETSKDAKVMLWRTRPCADDAPLAAAAPDPARHARLAKDAYEANRYFAVLAHLRRVPRAAWDTYLVSHHANALAELGRWDEAIAEFRRQAEKDGSASAWGDVALAQLAAGRLEDYRASCARILTARLDRQAMALTAVAALTSGTNPLGAACVAHVRSQRDRVWDVETWALAPAAGGAALALARAYRGMPLVTTLLRAGRPREALAELERDYNKEGATRLLWKALAHQQAGDRAAAARAFAEAQAALDRIDPKTKRREREALSWRERARTGCLTREYERGVAQGP